MEKVNLPQHIAIIMDGNGRWAKEHNLERTEGHREGIKRIKDIIEAGLDLGIKVVTFFSFFTENWQRPKREVQMLMRSLNNFLNKETNYLNQKNIRFRVIGREEPLPKYILKKLKEVEEKTKHNNRMQVVLALNYGARQEIIDAVKKISKEIKDGRISPEELEAEDFRKYLYAGDLPDPDLLIRTSGELRISNFLLWQISYTELYFPKKYWPDFRREDLEEAIREYQKRERRFGRVSDAKEETN
ncbi:MAG: isoprenyl transferase [Candidatus Omnitrophica bacterium]|nr:isoprenyl transferase [Candidatus Omnitrophota bacterium]